MEPLLGLHLPDSFLIKYDKLPMNLYSLFHKLGRDWGELFERLETSDTFKKYCSPKYVSIFSNFDFRQFWLHYLLAGNQLPALKGQFVFKEEYSALKTETGKIGPMETHGFAVSFNEDIFELKTYFNGHNEGVSLGIKRNGEIDVTCKVRHRLNGDIAGRAVIHGPKIRFASDGNILWKRHFV